LACENPNEARNGSRGKMHEIEGKKKGLLGVGLNIFQRDQDLHGGGGGLALIKKGRSGPYGQRGTPAATKGNGKTGL